MNIPSDALPQPTAITDELCADCQAQADDFSRADEAYLCLPCYEQRRNREAQRERLERRFAEAHRRGDLTMAFRNAGFRRSNSDIEAVNPEVWKSARTWEAKENLYLQGPPGIGKTFLARCVLRQFFVKGWNVAEVSARRLLKTADRFDEGRGDFQRWCEMRLVLLDDVDKVEATSRRLEALWEFFDRREAAELRTIVTSNIPIEQLAQCLQPRDLSNQSLVTATLDRLRPVRVLELTGDSQRGRMGDDG